MEVISSKLFILLTLAISTLLTSNTFCVDEFMMSSLQNKENYDRYSEPTGDPEGEKERSFNFEELKDWGPRNNVKISASAVNKIRHSAANLPLRFGRTVEEERTTGTMTNLPLRFGRYMKESILRRVPNLPQRFGRTASATKTLSDLLQQSMHSPSAAVFLSPMTCQPQESQNPQQNHPRKLIFKNIDGAELKPKKSSAHPKDDTSCEYNLQELETADNKESNTEPLIDGHF